MTKFCPFMSSNPSTLGASISDGSVVPCMDTCALYLKGFCSFNILAQKAINDVKKEKDNNESVE